MDNKDRGGSMTAICEMLRMIRTNQRNDPKLLKKIFTHVLGVGILTKNEGILDYRLMLLTDALNYFSQLSDEQLARIQNEPLFGEVTNFRFVEDSLSDSPSILDIIELD